MSGRSSYYLWHQVSIALHAVVTQMHRRILSVQVVTLATDNCFALQQERSLKSVDFTDDCSPSFATNKLPTLCTASLLTRRCPSNMATKRDSLAVRAMRQTPNCTRKRCQETDGPKNWRFRLHSNWRDRFHYCLEWRCRSLNVASQARWANI